MNQYDLFKKVQDEVKNQIGRAEDRLMRLHRYKDEQSPIFAVHRDMYYDWLGFKRAMDSLNRSMELYLNPDTDVHLDNKTVLSLRDEIRLHLK